MFNSSILYCQRMLYTERTEGRRIIESIKKFGRDLFYPSWKEWESVFNISDNFSSYIQDNSLIVVHPG